MNQAEFYKVSDEIRKRCDGMSARQVDDLIELLQNDVKEREAANALPGFINAFESALAEHARKFPPK